MIAPRYWKLSSIGRERFRDLNPLHSNQCMIVSLPKCWPFFKQTTSRPTWTSLRRNIYTKGDRHSANWVCLGRGFFSREKT